NRRWSGAGALDVADDAGSGKGCRQYQFLHGRDERHFLGVDLLQPRARPPGDDGCCCLRDCPGIPHRGTPGVEGGCPGAGDAAGRCARLPFTLDVCRDPGGVVMANRDQARVRYEERRRRVLYRWVIRILTIGFVSSMVLILAGLAIAWLRGEPLGEEVAPLPDVLPGVFDLSPQGIVDLGILVLLFTPAAYTAVSL